MDATERNRLLDALCAGESSTRLKAAMAVGRHADPVVVDALMARCAVEPDFFVREMLTWALTRLPAEVTVPRLRVELGAGHGQARSQALHTLSKIGDKRVWPAITPALLHDADNEVARSAWRAAVILVPAGQEQELAVELANEFGRGDRDVQLSLSQALVALGEVAEPVVRAGLGSADLVVAAHARATERLQGDPDAGFGSAVEEAKRVAALGGTAC